MHQWRLHLGPGKKLSVWTAKVGQKPWSRKHQGRGFWVMSDVRARSPAPTEPPAPGTPGSEVQANRTRNRSIPSTGEDALVASTIPIDQLEIGML